MLLLEGEGVFNGTVSPCFLKKISKDLHKNLDFMIFLHIFAFVNLIGYADRFM
jgi:hypothetical protein